LQYTIKYSSFALILSSQAEVYVVDDWEVERKHIQKLEELGKGSFGLVYRGLFSHPTNVCLKLTIFD
jgi:hypothetical protein